MASSGLTGLAKARWESQLIKTNRALVDYAGQLAQDDLLSTRLPDKVQKTKRLKPKKSHDKASKGSMTGAEAAEQEVNKAERAHYTCPRTLPGNIPGTDRVTGIDSARKDGTGAL